MGSLRTVIVDERFSTLVSTSKNVADRAKDAKRADDHRQMAISARFASLAIAKPHARLVL